LADMQLEILAGEERCGVTIEGIHRIQDEFVFVIVGSRALEVIRLIGEEDKQCSFKGECW
jgi:hypothetical protein